MAAWRWLDRCQYCSPSRQNLMRTRSARFLACIFFITRLRWISTVRSLMPKSMATALFACPPAIRSNTCRSRGVSPPGGRELLPGPRPPAPLRIRAKRCGGPSKQVFGPERLRQDVDGAALHRPHRHRYVAAPGDEDDRQPVGVGAQVLLKVETADVGEKDVQHEAAAAIRRPSGEGVEKRGRVGKGHTRVAGLFERQGQRVAHSFVVLDAEHGLT